MASKFRRNVLRNALIASLVLSAAMTAVQAQGQVKTFDISAQPAATGLNAFAEQADITLVFSQDVVAGAEINPLKGDYPVAEGLARMLEGTRLSYQNIGENTVVIGDKAASVPPLQLADVPTGEEGISTLGTITVTGSRVAGSADGPATVITFDQDAINRSGATQVRDVLRLLPQASTILDESGAQGVIGAAPPQLRGLSAGSTLMLLNGRRLNVSGAQFASNFFDLNQIPLAAVDRVEVLTDSATAIYGADAIGGAINILLKQDFQGLDVTARTGTSSAGDATEWQGSVVAGDYRGSFSGLLIASWFERDPVFKGDRPFTADSDFSRFGGLDLRSTLAYPGTVYSVDGQPLPGLTASFAGIPDNPSSRSLTPGDFTATDGAINLFEPAPYVSLIPETRRESIYAAGQVELSPDLELYGEALYSHVRQSLQSAPDALFGAAFGLFVVPAGNPFNPFGVDVAVDHRFVDLGPRITDADTQFTRFTAGVKGRLPGEFDFDLSWWRDHDDTTIENRNYVDYDKVFVALASTDPSTALNLFTTGGNSQTVLDSIRGDRTDRFESSADTVELVVRGDLFQLPAGAVKVAIGGDLRRESLDVSAPGVIAVTGERNSHALFAEASVPLVSPEMDQALADRLEATAAIRYDHFSNGIGTSNPQFGLLWGLTPAFSLRTTYGEAFKIPSLYNLFSPTNAFTTVVADPQRGDEPVDVLVELGGNQHIEPERARSWSAGFIFAPPQGALAGLTLTASWFRIEQTNFVQASFDTDLILANPDVFADRIVRATPTPEDIAAGAPGRLISIDARAGNFGQVTVEGVDFEMAYRRRSERFGAFGIQVLGSYVDSYLLQLVPGAPPQDVLGIANDSGFPVALKTTSVLSWTGDSGFGASLSARHRDSYNDTDGVRDVPAQTILDVQLSYADGRIPHLGDGWSGRLGVVNLTNKQADFVSNFSGYDPSQTDMRGRFYYLEIGKRF